MSAQMKKRGDYLSPLHLLQKKEEKRKRLKDSEGGGWRHGLAAWPRRDLPSSDRCKATQLDQKGPAGILSALNSQMCMKIGSQKCVWVSTVHMRESAMGCFNV